MNSSDVIIIGGGPAGMSAAAKCGDLGLTPLLIEQNAPLADNCVGHTTRSATTSGRAAEDGTKSRAKFMRTRRTGAQR